MRHFGFLPLGNSGRGLHLLQAAAAAAAAAGGAGGQPAAAGGASRPHPAAGVLEQCRGPAVADTACRGTAAATRAAMHGIAGKKAAPAALTAGRRSGRLPLPQPSWCWGLANKHYKASAGGNSSRGQCICKPCAYIYSWTKGGASGMPDGVASAEKERTQSRPRLRVGASDCNVQKRLVWLPAAGLPALYCLPQTGQQAGAAG